MDLTRDLLEHFRLDAEVDSGYTLHPSYNYDQTYGHSKEPVETRWTRCKKLGVGMYGRVYLEKGSGTSNEQQHVERAVKVIEKDRLRGLDYKREIVALSSLAKADYRRAGVIVDFLGWFENESEVHLAMEYLPLGDLRHYINDGLNEDEIRDIVKDLLRGLQIMHGEGFAHRDLKPANILVVQRPPQGPRWSVKIGDFGISKRVVSSDTAFRTTIGTAEYMAPEIKGLIDSMEETSTYDQTVDIWSLGCVIYNLATKKVPFPTPQSLKMFCDGKQQLKIGEITLRLGADGANFLESLLRPRPCERLTLGQAQDTRWLTGDSISQVAVAHPQKALPLDLFHMELYSAPSIIGRSQERQKREDDVKVAANTVKKVAEEKAAKGAEIAAIISVAREATDAEAAAKAKVRAAEGQAVVRTNTIDRESAKDLAVAKAAAEEAEKARKEAEEAVVKTGPSSEDEKACIHFHDAMGRRYDLPWRFAKTFKGMEGLIKQAHSHIAVVRKNIDAGRYDLIGPDDNIILHQVWEMFVQPGWEVRIEIWPDPPQEYDDPMVNIDYNHAPKGVDTLKYRSKRNQQSAFSAWILGTRPPPSRRSRRSKLGDAEPWIYL